MFSCDLCNRTFHDKRIYDAHLSTCELFYCSTSSKTKKTEFISPYLAKEDIPNNYEMFQLVQNLMTECKSLREEVNRLKININPRWKKNMLHQLSSRPQQPSYNFNCWIKLLKISPIQLEYVLKNELVDGIKIYINEYIKTTIQTEAFPLFASSESMDNLYIYSPVAIVNINTTNINTTANQKSISTNNNERWRISTTQDIRDMMNTIIHSFFCAFLRWKELQDGKEDGKEDEKEDGDNLDEENEEDNMYNQQKMIAYMMKLTNVILTHKNIIDMKRNIISQIQLQI